MGSSRVTPVKARKAKKPAPQSGKGKKGSGSELLGLFVLSLCLTTVIALLSEAFRSENGNLLGPWLGHALAYGLNTAFGAFPVLFFVAAATVAGYGQVTGKVPTLWRLLVLLCLFGLSLGLILSVHLMGRPLISEIDLQLAGGLLGKWITLGLLGPVFGGHQFGAYMVLCFAALFLLIWGFRLSVAATMERSAQSAGVLGRKLVDGLTRNREAEGVADDLEAWAQDDGIPLRRTEKLAIKNAEARGLKAKENSKTTALEVGRSGKAENRSVEKGVEGSGKVGHKKALPIPLPDPEELETLSQEELEALENLDPSEMDPLLVRKLRDLQLERQRVTELNEWEQKVRSPEISGLLGGKKGKIQGDDKVTGNLRTTDEIAEPQLGKKLKTSVALPDGSENAYAEIGDEEGLENDKQTENAETEEELESESFVKGLLKKNKAMGVADVPKPAPVAVVYDTYHLPELDAIFPEPPKQPLEFTEEELREQSKMLEAQLINFKVMGKVTQICPGPVITRYEVELAPGVKVNRIAGLADDLALALKAKSIRILAPIPGKSVVGIEVPNRKAQVVYIKEILTSSEFHPLDEDSLKVGLGKTIGGEPYVMDLTRAPHLLIAGQTGSGKSVCINSIMASLLASKTPDELRMILVDPKVVELKPYDDIPHLLHHVITQPDIAVQALKWATVEMDRRYEVLAQCGVRNIKGFNQKQKEQRLPESMDEDDKVRMPYIVIVIDELADLMMVAGKEVETSIARIAQKARAVGIHLILATQRPSTNVITGTIKANLPTRIAFQVASQIDARTIMDRQGAEKLLGRGDMLYKAIDFPEPVRLHGCYIDDDQCENLAGASGSQFVNYPKVKSFNLEEDPSGLGGNDEPRDELFSQAAELVVQLKQASVSLLQRRLGIGYARSGRLVDQLERAGIVGRERGSKPREVLMAEEELMSFLSSGLNDD